MSHLSAAATTALLLVLALVVQVSLLTRLDVPTATPHLVLVVAAAVGCARGTTAGAAAGFGGGLLLDLAPPADHPAGQWALLLTVVGHLAGRFGAAGAPERGQGGGRLHPATRARAVRNQPRRLALVAVLAAGATLAYVAISASLGADLPTVTELGGLAVAPAVYAAALAVPLLPATHWALRRASHHTW